ncbi:ABC transporter permease [Peribacillus sp. SCS-26]|uniref:ABC transporter permease n=1 Tax=Paraperibacillus marinus TaxID=3115295 RepID=UPI00390580DE
MQVFNFYLKRILKRRMTFLLLILLPVMFTGMVLQQYKEAAKVTLTMYIKDPVIKDYVSEFLRKQKVIVTEVINQKESLESNDNLGIVMDQSLHAVYQHPNDIQITQYARERNFNSKSLEVKLNSIFSTIQTLAKNSDDVDSFRDNMKEMKKSHASLGIKQQIAGSPHAAILTSTFNMIVFIMVFLTMTNTILFLHDKLHTTTQRILISTKSRLNYYVQTVGVFAFIGIAQFAFMLLLMTAVFNIDLELTTGKILTLLLAYGMLNIISAGLGLLLVSRTTKPSTGRLLVTVVSLPLAMLGGTLWPASIMPDTMQKIAKGIPTYWVTEMNTQMFSGFSDHTYWAELSLLLMGSCVIFFLLTRVKSGDI